MNPLRIPELLSCICYQLDRRSLIAGAQVCREWSTICVHLLWESCTFTAEQYTAFQDIFDDHALEIRHMEAQDRLMGNDIRFVALQCRNLVSLTLCYCHILPSNLDVLCSGILRVQSLAFDHCRGVNSSSIALRLTYLPSLSDLEIVVHGQERGRGDWREDDLSTMLTGCRSLSSLKIVGMDLSHVHLLGVMRHPLPLPLVHLDLDSTFISEKALGNLLGKSPALETLTLLFNANKNSTIQAIADNCPNLRMLDINNSNSIATATFDAVFRKCPLLRELYVSYTLIYDTAVLALAQSCPRLQVLDLTGCSRVTHSSFKKLMSKLGELKELKIRGCTKLKLEGFLGEATWASEGTLELLDMAFVGISAEEDEFEAVVGRLNRLDRLKYLFLDGAVHQHAAIEEYLEERSSLVVKLVVESAARPC